jgi:predicted lipid-binding transport protein (Tim44 family)
MKKTHKIFVTAVGLFSIFLWLAAATVNLAEARAGGGRSTGSRGSHSMSAPRPAFNPPPSSPTRPQTPPSSGLMAPGQQSRPMPNMPPPGQPSSGWGSFGRGLAGGLVGGMIGNMLFGGSGHAGPGGVPAAGGGCSSIGLFDLLIIGGLLYLGYRWFSRRQEAYQSAGDAGGQPVTIPTTWQTSEPEPEPLPLPGYDLKAELEPIQRTDPSFNEAAFKEKAQDVFFKLQGAWMRQDPTLIKDLATPELAAILEKDLQDLKAKGQINKLENIAIRQVAISEAWQEQGQDYITVGFLANLLDYTVDANTNLVVAGSDTQPVKFEEYWTFTRPPGPGPWKLSAITQPEG